MKILHISTSDIGHGAGVAAYRLHDALNRGGHHSRMLVSEKLSDDATVDALSVKAEGGLGAVAGRLDHGFEYLVNHLGPQNIYSVLGRRLLRHPWYAEADIVHLNNLHWHSRNFSPQMLPEIGRSKKIVWTLHDMWAFTGHCIYAYDCEKWREKCGRCPDLNGYIRLMWDTTRWLCNLKQGIYSRADLNMVTPSRWLGQLASESPLFTGCRFSRIPYSVDQEIFYPRQRSVPVGRVEANWPGRTLLFLSSFLNDERKGYAYFENAVCQLAGQECLDGLRVIAVGHGQVSERLKQLCHVVETGPISDRDSLAHIYSAADLFVMPSIQDNLPNTVLESLACGAPVVCFDAGGVPDMVDHGECGYVARLKDAADLAEGIRQLLSDDERLENMRRASLQRIEDHFTEKVQVERHLALYREILDGHA